MTGAEVLDVTRDSLFTMLMVAGPLLLVALVIGFGIGLLQALTQIQEATLTFVPKLIAMTIVLLLTAPLMGRLMGGLMERLAARIISG
ncbi:flagellar biosynthetic protein FliQ [Pedomonas mirosovicensis]|uniref:flagellar biosynthetic protein FliQ n=1 Tax=Pedomonas mirosovicensis TaxID=2908641 RepID=UPI002167C7CF|nr:flagellar biosynthetic protein FliQ [Pedomonas mirosovicensis]MCH8685120.1 flagellar biosynthetic protein FliQ [Pedomonas mirosovicensis]